VGNQQKSVGRRGVKVEREGRGKRILAGGRERGERVR
jgi:hypothetical protein